MIAENAEVPVCKAHVERITQCQPCQKRLAGFWRTMPKVEARFWHGMSAPEWHEAERSANEENQERLHSWAVATLYGDPNKLSEEPF